MACVIDSSAFYAYLVAADRHHRAVAGALSGLVREGERFFSTSFVLGETLGLLQIRHGSKAAEVFMHKIYPLVEWRWVDETLFSRIWQIASESPSRGFTIVDASVVACLQEHPKARCVAVDKGFERFGFPLLPG
ncbi:MAG: type II toxin-antitoxin system VapC family toxin [Deltaproteobacteria bacterium]|nr:type II toxin-antitoxin system VapC family toxin [Deltaproteobacteria bacterium]